MKRFLVQFFAGLIGLLLLIGAFVVIVDPFYHYHDATAGTTEYMYTQVYQTPGAALHFKYDSAIVGTSMTENFRASWYEEQGMDLVKLCFAGARSRDIATVYEKVFASGNDVKRVITDLNEYQLTSDPKSRYTELPAYLYNDFLPDDVQYIWNRDVFTAAILRTLEAIRGKQPDNDLAYTWTDPELFSVEKMERNYRATLDEYAEGFTDAHSEVGRLAADLEACRLNLENLTEYVAGHPEVQFDFFFPPYSIVYWERIRLSGCLHILDVYRAAAEQLMDYENVRVFFFMDETGWITDLDEYRDECHHSQLYNRYIYEAMEQGTHQLKAENVDEVFRNFHDYVEQFSYDLFWDKAYAVRGLHPTVTR